MEFLPPKLAPMAYPVQSCPNITLHNRPEWLCMREPYHWSLSNLLLLYDAYFSANGGAGAVPKSVPVCKLAESKPE